MVVKDADEIGGRNSTEYRGQPARVGISALEFFSEFADLIDCSHCLDLVESAMTSNFRK